MKYIQNIEDEAEAIKKPYDVLYYIKPLGSINLITATRYTAVDLGLPSGRLWANMNIGAEKETDYGLYFQWGDTVGYTDASHSTWATCPGNGGNSDYNVDSLVAWDAENLSDGILKPEVDAATVNMGGNWRMPTYEEYEELMNNTLVRTAVIDGVTGKTFTNKTDASKYIFIPYAGQVLNGSFSELSIGSYNWGSSLELNPPSYHPAHSTAASLYLCSGSYYGTSHSDRRDAMPVRGVC